MYSEEQVEAVRKLLAGGKLSIREIVKRTGMGRMTVIRIKQGYSPGKKSEVRRKARQKQAEQEKKLPVVINEDTVRFRNSKVEYVRCSGCGGMVQAQVPCMLCIERQRQQSIKEFDSFMRELWSVSSCWPS